MTTRIAIVGCAKRKLGHAAAARDLYTSASFRARRSIADRDADQWFVLSGLHGLVAPGTILDPYEKDLNEAGVPERRVWARKVLAQIEEQLGRDLGGFHFELLAGSAYCSFGLVDGLRALGAKADWPVKGMRQGEQGSYYSRRASPS